MKVAVRAVAGLAMGTAFGRASEASPIGKVLQLMTDLQGKILKEGEAAHATYSEFAEWCEDKSKDLTFEIKTAKAEVKDLKAIIDQQTAKSESLNEKLEKLSGDSSANEKELKEATEVRAKEHEAFVATEKELMDTVSAIQRAVGILEKELKGGASMLQLQNAKSVVEALSTLVQASKISVADATQLTALIQQRSGDEDAEAGAPAAAVYENKSGGIIETLSDLLDDANSQLDAARQKETKDRHAFELMEQALKDELKHADKMLAEAKDGIAAAGEAKSKAQGELAVVSKDLAADTESLAELHHNCMAKAEDYEAETKSRGEELGAIAKAKQVIQETVGGASKLSYGEEAAASLLQVGRTSSKVAATNYRIVRTVRALAQKHHSQVLAQLAARMATVVGVSSRAGEDPFAKVKALIVGMIEKLEGEAEADAKKKAYCDRELSESNEKKADKETELEKLTTLIDKNSARAATLKEEIADLQKALAFLAKSQAEMDQLRKKEKDVFEKSSAEMQQGLEGVKLALKVLNEYYAKNDTSSEGAASGIIALLEVVESDFTKGLSEMTSDEEAAQREYDEESKQNEIERTTKTKDVEYKQKETAELDKASAEAEQDRSGVKEELAAVSDYLAKIEKECVAKAETFEDRKARYEAEIAGLKEALQTLEEDTALVQRHSSTRRLRGVVAPHRLAA